MPHLVTNRPRVSNLSRSDPDDLTHDLWEKVSTWTYKLGGLTFIAGSIFFLPRFEAEQVWGDWLFFAGSLAYLLVTVHDWLEVGRFWRLVTGPSLPRRVEAGAATAYVAGTLLFAVGSVLFLPGLGGSTPGAWCFIIGSALFVVGGAVNLIQIVEAPTLIYLGLFNLTIANFLVGSTLFVVASIPFVWQFPGGHGPDRLFAFAGWQYIVGSALFFWGGLIISYRTATTHRRRPRGQPRTHVLVDVLRREIEQRGRLRPQRDQP